MENSFSNSVHYPQIPEFIDKVVPSSSSSTTLEDSMHNNIPNNDYLTDICNESADNSERTGIYSNGVNSSALALKDQPAIDGSTDTLVSEMGALMQEQLQDEAIVDEICDALANIKPACSVSTSTSDLPLTVENVLQTVTQNINVADVRLPNWSQNILQAFITNKRNSNASNSCSCSYTTPNHSRTPSSGFPATPCDDPSEMSALKCTTVQLLDVDGLNIIPNSVQERIKKIIIHYKVSNFLCLSLVKAFHNSFFLIQLLCG